MEIRWVIVWMTVIFGWTASVMYVIFTESILGMLSYIPFGISVSYATGVDRGIILRDEQLKK